VPDAEWLARIKSIGHLSRGRTQNRVTEGRAHPDSGEPFKAVTDELGHTVTEHGATGSGVSDRQDVHISAETVQVHTDAL
jgi:hypothetical protein